MPRPASSGPNDASDNPDVDVDIDDDDDAYWPL